MCRQTGISGQVELAPHLFLRPEEVARGQLVENQTVIQCMDRTSLNASLNKIWFAERYQEVVDQNRQRLNFVQLGSAGDPALRGVLDMRGKTTIRESAAILARSRLAVGYVGFLMHLARAVGCRGAFIFGGREHPRQSGYSCNENLFTELPCSPCWRRRSCDYDRECMQRIAAADVTAAITKILARNGSPLEMDTESIAPESSPPSTDQGSDRSKD
jgi:ADP-heptose:LPS heptosyltransferase